MLPQEPGKQTIYPVNVLFSESVVLNWTSIFRIWIEAAQEKLKEIPSKHPRCYYGFDISDAQFPQHLDNVAFVIQDVLKPFSAQHLSRYDLVHVRLLCGALKEQDYNVVAANMMSLLSKRISPQQNFKN